MRKSWKRAWALMLSFASCGGGSTIGLASLEVDFGVPDESPFSRDEEIVTEVLANDVSDAEFLGTTEDVVPVQPDIQDSAIQEIEMETPDTSELPQCVTDEECIPLLSPLGPCEVSTCEEGLCKRVPAKEGTSCTSDWNECTLDQCDDTGKCIHKPMVCLEPPAAFCDGRVLITYTLPGSCVEGECRYEEIEQECRYACTEESGVAHCVGEDLCEYLKCEEAPFPCLKSQGLCIEGRCVFEYDDGAPCDDGDSCTQGDQCVQGVCVGMPMACIDPPKAYCKDWWTLVTYSLPGFCERGTCYYAEVGVTCLQGCEVDQNGVGRCVGEDLCEALDCSEAPSPCFVAPGKCVGGHCVFALNDFASCEDNDLCTNGDRCEGGVCRSGTRKVCNDKNPCTDDSCDALTGKCLFLPNDMPCDDGNGCTEQDKCTEGLCRGVPIVCNSPPPPVCEGSFHLRIYNQIGVCKQREGRCEYAFLTVRCVNGRCENGQCIVEEGATVVGDFRSGSGGGLSAGLNLAWDFGGWIESKEGQGFLYVLTSGL